jgi:hypothetical protein
VLSLSAQSYEVYNLSSQIVPSPEICSGSPSIGKVIFFLVGGCACHLQNPAMKCDLPIGYFIPLTNREVAFRCRISLMARATAYTIGLRFANPWSLQLMVLQSSSQPFKYICEINFSLRDFQLCTN